MMVKPQYSLKYLTMPFKYHMIYKYDHSVQLFVPDYVPEYVITFFFFFCIKIDSVILNYIFFTWIKQVVLDEYIF